METQYKTIELENGHTLCIMDMSRKISEDAFVVKMKVAMEIHIVPDLFIEPLPTAVTVEEIQSVLGERITYEYEVERNFILNHEKDALFESMVTTYLNNLGNYVAKQKFPELFVLKAYYDKIGNKRSFLKKGKG